MTTLGIISLTAVSIFTLFILKKRQKVASDYLLILINIVLAIIIYSEFSGLKEDINGLKLFIHFNSIFWLGTSFLLYTYSLIKGNGRLVLKWWFFSFSIPFFLFSGYDLLLDSNKTVEVLRGILTEPNLVYHIFFKFHKVFIILVGFDILKNINRHNSELKLSYSFIENISLHWLRNYTILTMLLYSFHLVVFLLLNLGLFVELDFAYLVISILMFFSVFYLSFYGIQEYNFQEPSRVVLENEPEKKEITKQKVKTKSDENEIIFNQLKSLFEKEQTFTDPELRIGIIAKKIDVPTHRLSQAINDQFKKPFYDFVASYRTELLKQKLIEPKNSHFTILALARDAGFNSKASLNRIFKDQTGMTPSQYQKSHIVK